MGQHGTRDGSPSFGIKAYLVAAWAGAEVPVREVELFDTERAALLLVIVDELVLLQSRHGVCGCDVLLRAGGAQSRDTWGETRPGGSGREVSKETAEVQINAGRSVAVAGRGIHRR